MPDNEQKNLSGIGFVLGMLVFILIALGVGGVLSWTLNNLLVGTGVRELSWGDGVSVFLITYILGMAFNWTVFAASSKSNK